MKFRASRTIGVFFAGAVLAACNGVLESSVPKHKRAVPDYLVKSMKAKGMTLGAPMLLRIFKEENVMEVWKQTHTKRYALLNTYEICKWSGKLGPKHLEGDRQAPEGFYHVTPGLMNPNSSYHLSFNMGFPNTYDRANDRTGSFLMIHGACSSAGCYSMTDEYVEEIYAMARESFKGGQKAFQIQAFPFRLTAENMAKKVGHRDFEFWKMLKEGSDHFEVTNLQPKVDVCEKRYVFNRYLDDDQKFRSRALCPSAKMPKSLALAFNKRQDADQEIFNKILKKNAASPFVKEQDKPQSLNVSIKANLTKGPLTIFDPAAVAPTPTPDAPSAENAAPTAATVAQDPISSEVAPQQSSQAQVEQPAVIVQPVSQIAVPAKAIRTEPQS